MTPEQLRARSTALGFDIPSDSNEVDDDLAELLEEEFEKEASDTADSYDDMVAAEMEKEMIKAQRKQMAGTVKSKGSKSVQVQEVVHRATGDVVEIPDSISVKELAEKSNLSPIKIIGELMKNGILANINQQIDFETAHIISGDLGIKLKRKHSAASSEELLSGDLDKLLHEDDPSVLEKRAPVISIMGHVDHGKTKLLDTIRDANVVATESGGITQHIGAYQVEKNGNKITFLDTPGHEAFTAMRARGARATDIAILVVAADEGVKPQTIEAINHAKAAGIPIIVAINKMDKEGANPDRVKGELGEYELIPEDWGGDTPMVPVSALHGEGIDGLLDTILIVAEMQELKANASRPAVGTVVEAHLDPSVGSVATILINTGTLKIMDPVVVGSTSGRIKIMQDHTGKRLKSIGPSAVARIAGLSTPPQAGDILQVVSSEKVARQKAEEISELIQEGKMQNMGMGLSEMISAIKEGSLKSVKVVLKADTKGSLEAIKQSIAKELKSTEVAVRIIHSGVGNVTESDVTMAAASAGIVIGFHTEVSAHVSRVAERHHTEVATYTIIYELLDDLRKLLSGLLEPEEVINELGTCQVLKIFFTGKGEMVVGCKVLEGYASAKSRIRVFRGDEMIGEGEAVAVKLVNEDVDRVEKGTDFGLRFKGKLKIEEGDKFELYRKELRHKTL